MPSRRSPLAAALAVAAAAAVTVAIVVALGGAGGTGPNRPVAAALPSTTPAAARETEPPAASAGSPSRTAAPPSTSPPTPPPVPLPDLVGAIGDSLTVAVNAGAGFGEQPEHSWIVGDAPDDPVESHLERLRGLGADPAIVVAARPGARIGAAVSQAQQVVEAAADLGSDGVAYVTFELGANDVCAGDLPDTSDPVAFEAAVEASFGVLSAGLPPGSRLLVLSVPDVTRLRTVLHDVPAATALHRRYGVCRGVLGETVALDAVRDRIAAYNASLGSACDALAGSPVDCRHDLSGPPSGSLFGASFDLEDLSGTDFFHPSLRGQARIAEVSWRLTPWAGA